jgi:hypothetical protein
VEPGVVENNHENIGARNGHNRNHVVHGEVHGMETELGQLKKDKPQVLKEPQRTTVERKNCTAFIRITA